MAFLQQALAQARQVDLKEISKILAGLFGERISTRTVGHYMDRATGSPVSYQPGTGRIIGRTAMLAPALAKSAVAMPRHNFHASALPTEDDDDQ